MKPCIRATILTIVAASTLFASLPALADTTPETNHAPAFYRAAPADEYFGPLGLSILGIRNTLAETARRLERTGSEDVDTLQSVTLLEACVRDWETKYPRDSWLPGTVLALHRVYRKMSSAESVRHAVDTASWLISRYPESAEAGTARGELIDATSDEGPGANADVAPEPVEPPH